MRSRISVGSFNINLFGVSVYYKSHVKATVVTISIEAEFMASVSGAKYAKYISSILEDIVLSRKGPTKLFSESTAETIMQKSKKPKGRSIHIDVQHSLLQEWVDQKQVILEHITTHLNLADTSTKAIV